MQILNLSSIKYNCQAVRLTNLSLSLSPSLSRSHSLQPNQLKQHFMERYQKKTVLKGTSGKLNQHYCELKTNVTFFCLRNVNALFHIIVLLTIEI